MPEPCYFDNKTNCWKQRRTVANAVINHSQKYEYTNKKKVVIKMKRLISLLNDSYDGRKPQKRFLLVLNTYLTIKLIQFINFLFYSPQIQPTPSNHIQAIHFGLFLLTLIWFFAIRPLRSIKRMQWNFLTITLRWKLAFLSITAKKIFKEVI